MTGNFIRSFAALALAGLITLAPVAPVFGQAATPTPPQVPSVTPPAPQAPATAPEPARPLQIPIGPDYSNGRPFFPHLLLPYTGMHMDAPQFTNSPRIEQLIQNGQLRITMQDTIELALQNNTDLSVQRYNSWIAETDMLRAKGGAAMRGTTQMGTPALFADNPLLSYDPALLVTMSLDDHVIPVNNPLTAGTGVTTSLSSPSLTTHTTIGNFQYAQGFHTGTSIALSLNSTRNSTTSSSVRFNPALQTLGTISFTQQLLNGFGRLVNERYIRVSEIAKKATDYAFQQSVITDITAVQNDYWELVFARNNVAVAQRSVDLAQRLVEDNQRQVEIGTLAPIEVVRAQAQLAASQQTLINAQNAQLQQQTLLMSVITKDPLAPAVRDVEIVPLDAVQNIPEIENIPLPDAVTEALSKRPDVLQAKTNLLADDINVRTTKSALLPNLVLSGFANSAGLSGNAKPVITTGGITTFPPAGWFDSVGQLFQGIAPEYQAQIALTLPIRNRPAQADNARALLLQRQDQERLQQTYNAVAVDVRNSQIALRGARAALDAAQKTRILQEQTLAAEQTKFQLGASTIFQVVSDQRDLETAASAEVRAMVNLAEARVGFERAMGRTMEVHMITIADATSGQPVQNALIPGTTVSGQLVSQTPPR